MICPNNQTSSCPFAFNEVSEAAQGYGCLPSPFEIIKLRTELGKTWACHDEPSVPCTGAIKYLKEHNLPYKVLDKNLITERDNWITGEKL